MRFGIGQRTQLGLQVTSEFGNQPRIDRVGLGPFPTRLGIVPELSRVDYYYRQPGAAANSLTASCSSLPVASSTTGLGANGRSRWISSPIPWRLLLNVNCSPL